MNTQARQDLLLWDRAVMFWRRWSLGMYDHKYAQGDYEVSNKHWQDSAGPNVRSPWEVALGK